MLITKRAMHKKVWPGKWTVPGGGLESDDYTKRPPTHPGETDQWYGVVEHSIRREVMEETGLELTRPWFVTDLAFVRPDGIPVLVLSYAAFVANVKYDIVLDDDSIDFAWVSLHQAKSFNLIDGIYEELKMADRQRQERGVV